MDTIRDLFIKLQELNRTPLTEDNSFDTMIAIIETCNAIHDLLEEGAVVDEDIYERVSEDTRRALLRSYILYLVNSASKILERGSEE